MTREELRRKHKIPGPDTGIEVRHTMCDICTPGPQCGLDAYILDGKVIKVEGTKGFPSNDGRLCTKGAANRQFLYRDDRIRTPMRRVGPRGSGAFEPISWDEAYALAAEKLNALRDAGAEQVAFICGYAKWFRPFLQRLAFSFGSPNYCTESSACNRAEVMAQKCTLGCYVMPDLPASRLFVAWGANPYMNMFPMGRGLNGFKAHGGKILVVDPRNTHTAQKLADLYLRPKLGTDGVLAHAIARILLENGWHDAGFIEKYVHGFPEYRELVMQYDVQTAERITGVPAADIRRAAEMIGTIRPAVIKPSNGMTHHINGFQNYRAVLALAVITGQFDRPGTLRPEFETYCHSNGGFVSLEHLFATETRPATALPVIGEQRFPLFHTLVDEGQGMDFIRQVETGDPYPLRGAVLLGVNHRMYPDSPAFLRALDKLDFVLADDICWTDTCRHADLVLPASTSFERSEIKCYAGRFINYTKPAIPPVWDNRDDVRIITELANALELDDPLLRSGYDACLQYIMQPAGIADWEAFRAHDGPVPVPNAKPYVWGSLLEGGVATPTGKLELYSEQIAPYRDRGLDPLPGYVSGDGGEDPAVYPFLLSTGARLPNAIHTRTHTLSWTRSLRPDASVDVNPADAAALGIAQGDPVALTTPTARIELKANVTEVTNIGELQLYHGYAEANANDLLSQSLLDPYTGFPAYKQMRCGLQKLEKEGEA